MFIRMFFIVIKFIKNKKERKKERKLILIFFKHFIQSHPSVI